VQAVLRRTDEISVGHYKNEKLSIDFADMRVYCTGQEVKLTRKEFALLKNLVKSSGRVATRQNLLDNVWGYDYFGDARTLDVHIRRLRQKLGDCGNYIETVMGIGYRFRNIKENETNSVNKS
jgi:DNA-binding response OmpR family regulator